MVECRRSAFPASATKRSADVSSAAIGRPRPIAERSPAGDGRRTAGETPTLQRWSSACVDDFSVTSAAAPAGLSCRTPHEIHHFAVERNRDADDRREDIPARSVRLIDLHVRLPRLTWRSWSISRSASGRRSATCSRASSTALGAHTRTSFRRPSRIRQRAPVARRGYSAASLLIHGCCHVLLNGCYQIHGHVYCHS